MAKSSATVKAVLSGDTVVVVGAPQGGPPPEKTVHLAYVIAPKVAMKSLAQERKDDPHAWASREYLRKLLIGQTVEFKTEGKFNDRDEAFVFFNGKTINAEVIREGHGKLRQVRGDSKPEQYEELEACQKVAQDGKKGVWSEGGSETIREIIYPSGEETKKFVADNKGKVLDAIVEYVRDGSSYRLFIPSHMIHVQAALSGAQCDQWRRSKESDTQIIEEFAAEAKFVVEMRILNRDVKVRVDGCDDYGCVYVSVKTPTSDDLAIVLLKNGLAKIVEWSAKMAPSASSLRDALKEAQGKKIKKWRNHEAAPTSDQVYKARVIQVVSGDCIQVLPAGESAEKRVFLASLRAPKTKTRSRAEEPWASEAQEMLRKLVLGKEVEVIEEYSRLPPPNSPAIPGVDPTVPMVFVSIVVNQTFVAEDLVGAGLAKVIPHRLEDPRSQNYDALLNLQESAEKAQKGVHSTKPYTSRNVIELLGRESGTKERAKKYERELKEKKIEGYVEHIFHAGRYKVVIPSMSIAVSFSLAAVECPQTPPGPGQVGQPRQRNQTPEENKFAEEGLKWARLNLMQRDVLIQPDMCDKGGNFIGTMWLKQKDGNKNVAAMLLADGYGRISQRGNPAADPEIDAASKAGKEAKVRMWTVPERVVVDDNEEGGGMSGGGKGLLPQNIEITHINDINDFFVIDTSPGGHVQMIQDQLAAVSETNSGDGFMVGVKPPKENELVMCEYSADSKWYRGRVLGVSGNNVEVAYIDFGNTESRPISALRKLPDRLNDKAYPPQCFQCALSGLREARSDLKTECVEEMMELSGGVTMTSTAEGKRLGKIHVILRPLGTTSQGSTASSTSTAPPSPTESFNELLVMRGVARVDKRAKWSEVFTKLQEAEETAKKSRLFIWAQGDFGTDEEERR